jgi:LuxR family maltose regulon positive regulatory protein
MTEATISPEPELVVTKLWAPVVRPVHVPRERPLALLRAGEGRTLTLVAAPAGSGKTTALAQWFAAVGESRAGAWFSVDRSDNDPTRFWTYAITAIREGLPAFGETPLAALRGGADVATYVLPPLINELAASRMPLALVIDDYHLIANPAIHAQLEQLLDRVPGHVQVVVAARADPPLPLNRWRGRGQLAEIRASELRFSPPEAQELFGRMDVDLAADDVGRLVERTEGWAAGLSLAGLSLAGQNDAGAFVEAFAGTGRHVVDYLASEVLAGLPAEAQRFLVSGSVLTRLSGPLCDAVLERRGSARLLAELERSNAFVVPLGDSREWYRLHHLFAEVLAAELRDGSPQLVPVLHRRASRWYAGEGMTFEAIEHAVAAADAARVADLLMPVSLTYLTTGQSDTVLGWLRGLGEEAVSGEPRLCLIAAAASLVRSEGPQTARWLELAEQRAYDGPLPGGPASIEAGIATVRGVASSGRLSYHLEAARRAVELSRDDTSPWRTLAVGALGLALYWAGDLEQASPWIEATARLGPPLLRTAAYGLMGVAAADGGDAAAAERLAADGRRVAEEHHLQSLPPYARVLLAAGRAAMLRGAWAPAASSLEGAIELLRLTSLPFELGYGLLALAEVRHAAGASDAARAALLEARALIEGLEESGILARRLEDAQRRLAGRPAEAAPATAAEELSAREREVLRLLPSGLSEAEIGSELFISYHTVHSHIRTIYRKLGTSSRAQTVERARAIGLLPGTFSGADGRSPSQ